MWCLSSSGKERGLYLPQISNVVRPERADGIDGGCWRLLSQPELLGPVHMAGKCGWECVLMAGFRGFPHFHKYQLGAPHPRPKDSHADGWTKQTAILAKVLFLRLLLCRVFAAKRPVLAEKVIAKITRDFTPGNMLSPYGLRINNTKQVLHSVLITNTRGINNNLAIIF